MATSQIAYPNLESAMLENSVRKRDIARLLNRDMKSIWNKLNGRSEFSVSEALKIRDSFFQNDSIGFLFQREPRGGK